LAIANLAIGPLDEMLQQPGCPNLYWALTDLPTPFISLRNGLQGERVMHQAEFAGFDQSKALSDAELRKLVDRIDESIRMALPGRANVNVKSWLEKKAKDERHVAAALKRLAEVGLEEVQLKEFAPLQVILLDEKRAFEQRRDDIAKLLPLPYWQAEADLLASPSSNEAGAVVFDHMQIGTVKVRKAQVRLEQRIALLRHVEAIRLYAAEHDGKLPASLNDITVPLPVDPFTGQPFRYHVDGLMAEIRGSPPRGESNTAAYNVRYVVTIKK